MEVFQNSGKEGVLTICLDGNELVHLNFKNQVQVSVRYNPMTENVISNPSVSDAEKPLNDCLDSKEKGDPLDEELNGFIQRVKHSENGSGNLFPNAAQDLFTKTSNDSRSASGKPKKYFMSAGEGDNDRIDDSLAATLGLKRKRDDDDDDNDNEEEEDDDDCMETDETFDDESLDVKKEGSMKADTYGKETGGNVDDKKGENIDSGDKNESTSLDSSVKSAPPEKENKTSVTDSKQKNITRNTRKSLNVGGVDKKDLPMALEGKYMRLKGKRIHTIYKCNICEQEFTDSYKLSIHQRAESKKEMCSMCDLECMSKANLIIHEHLMHSNRGKSSHKSCPVCSKTFQKHSEILNHVRAEHTNEGLYRCCSCKTLFQNYHSFKLHLDTHRLEKLAKQDGKATSTNPAGFPTMKTKTDLQKGGTENPASSSRQKPQVAMQLRSLMNYQVPKPSPKPVPKPITTPSKNLQSMKSLPQGKLMPPGKTMQLVKNIKSMLATKQKVVNKNLPPGKNLLQVKLPNKNMLPNKKRALGTQSKSSSALPTRSKPGPMQKLRKLPLQSQATLARKKMMTSRRAFMSDKLWKCHFCERVFKSKGEYINHKKPSRITQMCKECGFTSTSKALYLIHEYQKHTHRNNDRYTLVNENLHCHICEEPILLNEVLNHVMRKHTGEHPYECCVCKKAALTYEDWVVHGKTHLRSKEEKASLGSRKLVLHLTVKTEDPNNQLFCNLCKQHHQTEQDLVRHHKSETQKRECELCRIICYTAAGYVLHKYLTHGVSPSDSNLPPTNFTGHFKLWHEDDPTNDTNMDNTKCPSCQESFPMKDLVSHMMSAHTQESPYKCCACKTLCPNLDNYIDHCDHHLGKKLYTTSSQRCLVCGLRFDSRIRLSRHKIMHKPACPYCQLEFNSKALLDVHLKNLHTQDMTACGFCGKLFADMNQLAEHERNHYFYKKSQCPICGVLVTNVNKHLARKHPKPDTQFLCNLCGQKFPLRCDLSRHLSKHSNDRRHECDICKKTFKRAAGLRRHAQSHLQNRKMHECHICGKKCSQRNNLSVHMRVHASVKAFTCEHCGQGFNYNQSLQTHIRKKHVVGGVITTTATPVATTATATTRPPIDMTPPINPVTQMTNSQQLQPRPPAATVPTYHHEHPGYQEPQHHYYPDPAYVPVNAFQRSYSDLINTIVRSEHETQQGAPQQSYPVFYPQF